MKICNTCILTDAYPGIRFNEDGVCSQCWGYEKRRATIHESRRTYKNKFIELIDKAKKDKSRPYDVIMAYSGGKDSSYTLMLLTKEYNLRVLAMTFDHGFMSPQALSNIRHLADVLGVDHLCLSPARKILGSAFQRSIKTDVYPMKALERASAICNTCMNLVKSAVLKTAIEMNIPFLAYGWSPGQAPIASSVMKLNESMVRQMQEALVRTTGSLMGDAVSPYVLQSRHYQRLALPVDDPDSLTLYAVHPLAFIEYYEEAVAEEIKKIGWRSPADTDTNSTNCLLNALANHVHLQRYGFHPYAFEVAGLVREGCMTREEGLAKISAPADETVMKDVAAALETIEGQKTGEVK